MGNFLNRRNEMFYTPIKTVFRQLVRPLVSEYWSNESGVTSSFSDGVATVSTTTLGNGIRLRNANVKLISGDVYLIYTDVKTNETLGTVFMSTGSSNGVFVYESVPGTGAWRPLYAIKRATGSTNTAQCYLYATGSTYENLQFRKSCIYNLTKMLGSDIAENMLAMDVDDALVLFNQIVPGIYRDYSEEANTTILYLPNC